MKSAWTSIVKLIEHFSASNRHYLNLFSDKSIGLVGWKKFLIFALICSSLGIWQSLIQENPTSIESKYHFDTYRRGMYKYRLSNFFYFYYYTGYFPVGHRGTYTKDKNVFKEYNQKYAYKLLDPPHSSTLVNEIYIAVRTGDLAKIFLFYPDTWQKGEPRAPKLTPANKIIGLTTILALFIGFSLSGYTVLGLILSTLFGSNPFLQYELYVNDNIWGLNIACSLLLFSIHAPLIFRLTLGKWKYLFPVVSGVLISTFAEARPEIGMLMVGVLLTYILSPKSHKQRAALVIIFLICSSTTSALWGKFWDTKFQEAYELVEEKGGVPYDGIRYRRHRLWHAIWCGLGDFGRDKGYRWSDRKAYAYGIPKLNKETGSKYTREKDKWTLNQFYDEKQYYPIKPEDLVGYLEVLKSKVLSDVLSNPVWYANIIIQRLHRVFTINTPIRVPFLSTYIEIPFSAYLFIPMLIIVILNRNATQFLLLTFLWTTHLSAIIIYSGRGFTYLVVFHYVCFALFLLWVTNWGICLFKKLQKVGLPKISDSKITKRIKRFYHHT